MSDGVDFSDLHRLEAQWRDEAKRLPDDAEDDVDEVVQEVASEARATAAGYPKGTGALAAAVRIVRVGAAAYTVGAAVREAFYLEVGSPNTGGPRPWLTGPAQRALDELVGKIGKRWD